MNYVPINGVRMLGVEIALLLLLTSSVWIAFRLRKKPVSRPRWLEAVLAQSWRSVLLVVAVAVASRALLLPFLGVPQPRINDEYSYLLMADTFAHGRLTNPTPPSYPHFETFHVNAVPTYHSKYGVAQGIALAFGEVLFHQPWIGVYLSTAILCGAICWALQAFLSPGWALLAALLATVRIAPFSYWMNSYWGGSMAALGGALALGSVVRLFHPQVREGRRVWLSVLFAVSLLILATSRPYEGLAFAIPLLIYFGYKLTIDLRQRAISLQATFVPALVVGLAGLAMMGYYNRRTTGDPLLLPHLLNERTYSPLPLFLWQHPKAPSGFHDPVFKRFYKITEKAYGYKTTRSPMDYLNIELNRLMVNWFFYCGVALTAPAVIGFLAAFKAPRLRIVVFIFASTLVAVALCTYILLHYAAPATVALYVFVAEGLYYLWSQGDGAQAFVVAVCLTVVITSLTRQTGSASDIYGSPFPNIRQAITEQLDKRPGKQLVLVSYDLERHYPADELVHNGADFASQKILWARSKGADSDKELCRYFADRSFWSVTTDDHTYSLAPISLCNSQLSQ